MILEQETFEKYGYKPSELLSKSNKFVIIKCDYCSILSERRKSDLFIASEITPTHSCGSKTCASLKRIDNGKILFQDKHPKIGDKFGRWTVIDEIISNLKPNLFQGHSNGFNFKVKCQCECGKEKHIQLNILRGGQSLSCGCLKHDLQIKRQTKHSACKTKLHNIWVGMRDRCNNPNAKAHKWYYSKGIRVCEEWNDFIKFKEWAESHGYKEGLSIDRIDSDLNYCPENCRWLTVSENAKWVGESKRIKIKSLTDENNQLRYKILDLEKQLLMAKNLPIPESSTID